MTNIFDKLKRSGGNAAGKMLAMLAPAAPAMLFAAPAEAYVGPSLGLGVIGAVIGVLAAVVLTVFGLLWYPLKRMFGKKPALAGDGPDLADADTESAAEDRAD